jgi:putative intracellular protease/amidase
VYTSAYVSGEQFQLYLRPQQSTRQQVLSLLPDYLPLSGSSSQIQFTVNSVQINGRARQLTQQEQQGFYVAIRPEESGQSVVARLNVVLPQQPVQPQQQQQQIRAKVGVIIEKHYDETEVEVFKRVFANSGYQLEFISNLSQWNVTESEYTGNDYQQPIRVRTDFNDVDLTKYAGFILVGGYAMDRLRYEVDPRKGVQNQSRAVEFIQRVFANPNLKVGTICHSAWLLSAGKQLLANRELTCAHNVISDILNAGGLVQYEQNGTGTVDLHVHGNLISAKHPQVSEQFATRFIQELNAGFTNSVMGV